MDNSLPTDTLLIFNIRPGNTEIAVEECYEYAHQSSASPSWKTLFGGFDLESWGVLRS
jgi:hypothetical protein